MDLLLLIGLLLFISGKILIQEYVLHLHCWIMNIDPEITILAMQKYRNLWKKANI